MDGERISINRFAQIWSCSYRCQKILGLRWKLRLWLLDGPIRSCSQNKAASTAMVLEKMGN